MKRSDLLAYIRNAGYHSDTQGYMRLFVENRISRKAADEAYRNGTKQKLTGVKCHCHQCTGAKP